MLLASLFHPVDPDLSIQVTGPSAEPSAGTSEPSAGADDLKSLAHRIGVSSKWAPRFRSFGGCR